MIKVKILKTGKVVEVLRNKAHSLIDRGLARLITAPKDKMLKPRKKRRGYRIK